MRVEEPVQAGAEHGALHDHISNILRVQPQPWKSFGETARTQVEMRAANIAVHLNLRTKGAQAGG